MCTITIIDINVLCKIVSESEKGYKLGYELHSWIKERHGILVYPLKGKFSEELRKNTKALRLLESYRQAGQVELIDESKLENAEKELPDKGIKSDDEHILALALASDALVLCSEDEKLKKDFRKIPNVNRKRRAVYPIKGRPKRRNNFLQKRRCPNRKIT